MTAIHCGRFRLSLDRPLVMGIVNLTQDSFSGDGIGSDVRRAIAHAHAQIEAGADILDLGAESSRPGAEPVSVQQELDRLLPVIEGLRNCGAPLSVDTTKPAVMCAALAVGADMINDITALRTPGSMEAVVESNAAVCLMHMKGEPRTMQADPRYGDVVIEVVDFLASRVAACESAGIERNRIVIDPGFGFGKTLAHNLAMLRALSKFSASGYPVLAGISRKSMLGAITGRPPEQREAASVAAAMIAAQSGAAIVRVHDVAATRDALNVLNAVENS